MHLMNIKSKTNIPKPRTSLDFDETGANLTKGSQELQVEK